MALKPYESSALLVQRARKHLLEFGRTIMSYVSSRPYSTFLVPDAYAESTYIFKLVVTVQPPGELSAIAFDIINCLRSALDHVVFDASRSLGNAADPRFTKFPFGQTRFNAEQDLERKKAEVPTALRPFLLAFEPWEGGKYSLYELNNLRNLKIHRILEPATGASEGLDIISADGKCSFAVDILNRQSKDGFIEVARLKMWGDCTNMKLGPGFCLYFPALPKLGVGTKDAACVLSNYTDLVNGIVEGIEAEASRLIAESV